MDKQSPKFFVDLRPWGEELWIKDKEPSMIKVIVVDPGQSLSLQYHNKRDEFWRVIGGNGKALIDDKEIMLEKNSECFIERGQKHRLYGGTEKLILIELAYGEFDENDIVRLEDQYGRI